MGKAVRVQHRSEIGQGLSTDSTSMLIGTRQVLTCVYHPKLAFSDFDPFAALPGLRTGGE